MNRKNAIVSAAFAITIILQCLLSLAQAPQKVSYQSIIRNSSGELVRSGTVGMRISILQGSSSGSAVYVETHSATTNINGLVTIEVGNGTPETGTFSAIDWGSNTYFLKVEADPSADGETSYTITGTSEILSVPYALHAKTTEGLDLKVDKVPGKDLAPNGSAPGQMQYWNGSAWVVVAPTINQGASLQMIGGVPTWVGGTPSVINTTTGKIWMDRNLGASQVATSSTDAASYGDLYQWGRAADGHQIRTSATITTLSSSDTPVHGNFISAPDNPFDWRSPQNDNLWQGINGTNNPCPSGYRLPTDAEWNAERLSWGSNNSAGAFASLLKLPVAGNRGSSGGFLDAVGSSGLYWSSTVDGISSRYLFFFSSNAGTSYTNRAYGFSVRCIKD